MSRERKRSAKDAQFVTRDNAPAGWENMDQPGTYDRVDGKKYETWFDADGNLVYVPVKYPKCFRCNGTGRSDYDGDDCWHCDGEGYEWDAARYCFTRAISKPIMLRVRKLREEGKELAGVQWWDGAP